MNLGKDKTSLIIIAIAIILVLVFMNKILSVLGIRKSKTKLEKQEAEKILQVAEYFNPSYYKTKPHKPLGPSTAKAYAEQLHDSWKFFRRTWGANEDKILGVFAKLDNKTQISEVAEQYYLMRKDDLRARVMRELNAKEQVQLLNIIKSMPDS